MRRRAFMGNIERDELLKKIGSIYKLCNLAALRAMELNSGMKKLVDADPNEKVTTVAIKEIAQDKVKLKAAKA
jgi:DNA-directed RNA polymerase omega subunit